MDIQKLAKELEFDEEDVAVLVEVFFESAKESLSLLNSAIATKNYQDIASYAHTIKGSSANLMLEDVVEIARQIELDARYCKDVDYVKRFSKLEQLIEELHESK